MVDENALQKSLIEENLNFFHFTQKRINLLKPLSSICPAIFLQRNVICVKNDCQGPSPKEGVTTSLLLFLVTLTRNQKAPEIF
jgi:hypothetical protein